MREYPRELDLWPHSIRPGHPTGQQRSPLLLDYLVVGTCRWRIHKVTSGEREADEDCEINVLLGLGCHFAPVCYSDLDFLSPQKREISIQAVKCNIDNQRHDSLVVIADGDGMIIDEPEIRRVWGRLGRWCLVVIPQVECVGICMWTWSMLLS